MDLLRFFFKKSVYFFKIFHSLIKHQFQSNNTTKNLLKITLFSIITLSFSGVYAQEVKPVGKRTGVKDAHHKIDNQESEEANTSTVKKLSVISDKLLTMKTIFPLLLLLICRIAFAQDSTEVEKTIN